ncbi:dihydropteroate synthase [Saxibacter everestensis]|uniref:Dihydropteroate synthase n=1 Tax=Saxibacter everestensis TaxID=2909229 RepID=A0ABY8R108_9MICO|nr:dihydropteroate synthase [Brevibacteriaceae bacterium ZFBP1038]
MPVQRTRIMGVVNVTPDSFSDGGRFFDHDLAIRHGLALLADGADIIDVGGESTRPGSARVSGEEEQRRVLPVIEALVAEGATVSVDTTRVDIARLALGAGAHILNDVSGAKSEPAMAALAAEADVPLIVMHWREASATMQGSAVYDDVVRDVVDELRAQLDVVREAGVSDDKIIVDPGLGFSKTGEHNWSLLAGLDSLQALGFPVLVAASRKRFLSTLVGGVLPEVVEPGQPAGPSETEPIVSPSLADRDAATAAVTALAARAGAWCVRVHDARGSRIAVEVARAWNEATLPAVGIAEPLPGIAEPHGTRGT